MVHDNLSTGYKSKTVSTGARLISMNGESSLSGYWFLRDEPNGFPSRWLHINQLPINYPCKYDLLFVDSLYLGFGVQLSSWGVALCIPHWYLVLFWMVAIIDQIHSASLRFSMRQLFWGVGYACVALTLIQTRAASFLDAIVYFITLSAILNSAFSIAARLRQSLIIGSQKIDSD